MSFFFSWILYTILCLIHYALIYVCMCPSSEKSDDLHSLPCYRQSHWLYIAACPDESCRNPTKTHNITCPRDLEVILFIKPVPNKNTLSGSINYMLPKLTQTIEIEASASIYLSCTSVSSTLGLTLCPISQLGWFIKKFLHPCPVGKLLFLIASFVARVKTIFIKFEARKVCPLVTRNLLKL